MKRYTPEEFRGMLVAIYLDGPAARLGAADDWAGRVMAQVQKWLDRGDGATVYENQDLGHLQLGDKKIMSYGSPAAQLEGTEPPERLPDIGSQINWRYRLIGIYGGPAR
jgi:hypothetical protein